MTQLKTTKKTIQQKNWCFTDFELLDITKICDSNETKIKYCCWGLEICPETKRKHHQGWIQLAKRTRLTGVKKLFKSKQIHLEPCKGTEQQNEKYCQKDNIYDTWGEFTLQGQRTEIATIYKEIENGMTELQICRKYPREHAKFHKAFRRKIEL